MWYKYIVNERKEDWKVAQVFERDVTYVEAVDENGRVVTHMFFGDMGRFSKKKSVKTTTRNINGKVVTEIIQEK